MSDKSLVVIEERTNLHKRQKICCHLRNGYLLMINQFMMVVDWVHRHIFMIYKFDH